MPVNRPVALTLHSKDVGHAFYVPELRIQQDFVPGLVIPLHFTATKVVKKEIVCTQLCGLGHYNMRAYLEVMPEEQFQQWLEDQARMSDDPLITSSAYPHETSEPVALLKHEGAAGIPAAGTSSAWITRSSESSTSIWRWSRSLTGMVLSWLMRFHLGFPDAAVPGLGQAGAQRRGAAG